ncbi:MAG: hypothetical protein HC799_16040 [Limnothrix sp. RL_2_0]|nr:hypothetical protein [Limnothrix sp. RL_2_0]
MSDPNVDLLPGNEAIEPIIHEATDYDGPRFGTRNARFSFNCRWYLTANISDTIFYIASEMDINKDSVEVLIIKSLNRMAKEDFESVWLKAIVPFFSPLFAFDELMKGLAYAYWAWLVKPGGKWDHKPSINPTLGLYSLDAPQGKQYFNDIWSNMHYGYIGKVAGFTEKELIGGAGLAQVIDDLIKASEKDFNRLIGIANDIVSLDPDKAWNALRDLITDTDIQEVLTQVYERFRQEGITGLDNNDDSGSVLLGSDRLYDEYADGFVSSESSREFILGIVRRRRKYSPNSQLKKDAPEDICSI